MWCPSMVSLNVSSQCLRVLGHFTAIATCLLNRQMCFNMSFYISLALHSLTAYGTTPDSVSRLIHKLNDGLDYLILQGWKGNTSQEV